jgi:hypothetical protein
VKFGSNVVRNSIALRLFVGLMRSITLAAKEIKTYGFYCFCMGKNVLYENKCISRFRKIFGK